MKIILYILLYLTLVPAIPFLLVMFAWACYDTRKLEKEGKCLAEKKKK